MMALFEWVTGRQIKPRAYLAMQVVGVVMMLLFFGFLSVSNFKYMLALRR